MGFDEIPQGHMKGKNRTGQGPASAAPNADRGRTHTSVCGNIYKSNARKAENLCWTVMEQSSKAVSRTVLLHQQCCFLQHLHPDGDDEECLTTVL